MQEQITALGALDDEIVRISKWYATSLDQLASLEKGHEREFEVLRDLVSATDAKRKVVQKSKTALLKLEGYLLAQGSTIAKIVSSKEGSVGDFFSKVLERVRHDADELVTATSTEVKLDLGQLHSIIEQLPVLLGTDGAAKFARKSFDARTDHVEQQGEHLVNAAKVVEQILDKAIGKLIDTMTVPISDTIPVEQRGDALGVTADSRTPGNESKGPEEEGEEDEGWVPGHRTEAAAV